MKRDCERGGMEGLEGNRGWISEHQAGLDSLAFEGKRELS